MRLWVDTDVGTNPDDAVCLLTALAHPGVDLVGVSVVDGDVATRARVARSLLPEGIDVIAGSQRLAGAVEAADPEVVVGVGPAANLATLLRADRLPERVVQMAGALEPVVHRGERRLVESNAAGDPESLRALVASGRCTLVPLDVTHRMLVDGPQIERLIRGQPGLEPHLQVWQYPVCLHDPLALLVAVDNVDLTVERRTIDVAADGRIVPGSHECDVVVDVDIDGAIRRVMELLAPA